METTTVETKTLEELEAELQTQECAKANLSQQLASTESVIKELREQIKKVKSKDLFPKICEVIDNIFNLPENKGCNIVILNSCNQDYDTKYFYEYLDWEATIYVTIRKNDTTNKWATAVELSDKNGVLLEQFCELANDYIPSSRELYTEDNGVNSVWYGIVAVSKDYKIVGFVCRDDNLMSDCHITEPDVLVNFK